VSARERPSDTVDNLVFWQKRNCRWTGFGLFFGTVHQILCPSRRTMAVLLFVLAVPCYLSSQSSAVPAAGNKSDAAAKQDFSQEPFVYEYLRAAMRYENDGSGTREVRARVRVQTPAGLNSAGQLIFQYSSVNEQVEIRSVRVLKSDGNVVAAGPETVQDLSAPVAREAPMYTDARQKHVTVPGLAVGDVVEYDVVIDAKPLLAGQFWYIWNFEQRAIALDEQLDLNVPANRAVKIKSSEGIEASNHVDGDRRLYHWATANLKTPPPVDIFKDFKFDVVKLLGGERPPPAPRVMFSTFQSWTEVADWYAELERDRRVPTPEIRAKADEIARGQQTEEAKAQALYYWVSQNIRYVSLSFGVGRYQPHPAAEVFSNRYGDCKDKTTLLEAMLDAEGLHAHAVLASMSADVDADMPNPWQFDHAYTFLQVAGKDTWLDSTLGVGPFDYLAPQLRGKEALVVSEAHPDELRQTPQDFPFTVEYRVGVNGTVDANGTLDSTVELRTRGDLEVLIRLLNDHLSKEQLDKSADSVLARTNKFLYDSVHYSDFKVLNASDTSQPVKAQFHVTGKMMYVNPKDATPAQLADALTTRPIAQWHLLTLLPGANSKLDSKHKPEQLPTDLKGPRIYSLDLNLAFGSFVASDPPLAKDFRITEKFAEYTSSNSWQGNTFHASTSLDLRVPTIPASDAKEYAAFVEKIVEATAVLPASKNDSNIKVAGGVVPKADALTPSGSSAAAAEPPKSQPADSRHAAAAVPTHVPATETVDLYKRGQEEAKRKNWANAIEAFGSAVKADPQYPEAWRELGRAHMYARQYPDAEAAFRKYLELAPDDHLAYLNMAWVLYTEKKYELVEDLLVKRIAVAPKDGDALSRLGAAYLALHLPEQAVPVLERATVQLPKYAAAHFALGRAYLETGQDDLAVETFRKVLELDDSENMLNSIAYALAEHGSSLDVAGNWSQLSIGVVEKELNESSSSNVQSQTWALVVKLAQYWDTMGWIKFQQGKMEDAEKYLFAAWQLADDLTVGMHLGRLYETQGRKNDAIEMYLAALQKVPPNVGLSDDAKETRRRLAAILGGYAQVDDRLEQSHNKKSPLRTVSIANPGGAQGIAQYTVIIDANAKVVDIAATNSDDPLANLNDAVRTAAVPQSFPDTTLKKLPRLSTLACVASDQPCVLTLLPAGAGSRFASPE
jgi:tetratricopeptide (TPR) repeat protein